MQLNMLKRHMNGIPRETARLNMSASSGQQENIKRNTERWHKYESSWICVGMYIQGYNTI